MVGTTGQPDDWPPISFVGGHPSLDFLNTAGGRTKARDVERLERFTDAIGWARAAGVLDAAEAGELATLADADPASAAAAVADLHAQREALHAFLLASIDGSVDGSPAPAEARARVESDLISGYRAARLSDRLDDDAGAWLVSAAEQGLGLIGRRLALATGALLAGPDRGHIRVCHRCSWLFLDPSPSKRRRWCSMAVCGNRTKAGRHYQRRSTPD
ncbi:CGNR zinc finger domain-containing protein [Pseudonocardia acaciae]|uniref:CGNR zinc finger domain-containing protein n=1 Tax=Pseudonocardia acaciae TaxID=551276 RepID=UPI00048D9785|nr:CGNR zinc finger domain-containing protein [Pseudonocardia acaciae]